MLRGIKTVLRNAAATILGYLRRILIAEKRKAANNQVAQMRAPIKYLRSAAPREFAGGASLCQNSPKIVLGRETVRNPASSRRPAMHEGALLRSDG